MGGAIGDGLGDHSLVDVAPPFDADGHVVTKPREFVVDAAVEETNVVAVLVHLAGLFGSSCLFAVATAKVVPALAAQAALLGSISNFAPHTRHASLLGLERLGDYKFPPKRHMPNSPASMARHPGMRRSGECSNGRLGP